MTDKRPSGRDVTHTFSTNGRYSVVLSVNDRPGGTGLSNSSAPLVITVGNRAPTPTITAPVIGSHYSAETRSRSPGRQRIPKMWAFATVFNWSIVFHHNTHTHPLNSIPGVTSGTFQIPFTGEADPDQWYRISLTVTDSGGLQQQTYVDVLPNLSTFTLASNVAGAQISLDGLPRTVPATITGVVGMQRVLSAPTQTINNQTYAFASWSDGGAATHSIFTPSAPTNYTATFQQVQLPYAALYSTTIPNTWSPGQTRTFTTTITNTGTQTWNATDPNAVHLGVYFNGNSDAIYDWPSEPIRFNLPQNVAPGASVTLNITMTAPVAPGSYVLRERLVKENVQWFAQLLATPVSVGSAGTLTAIYATTAPATWLPGQTRTFSTTVTNTGTTTWNATDPQAVHLGVYFNGNSDNANDWPSEP